MIYTILIPITIIIHSMSRHTIHDYYNQSSRTDPVKVSLYKNVLNFVKEYKITTGLMFVMVMINIISTIIYPRLLDIVMMQCDMFWRSAFLAFVHTNLSHLIVNLYTISHQLVGYSQSH